MPTFPANESKNEINNALGYGKDALTNNERRAEGKERSRHEKEEELCDALEETQPIALFVIISRTLAPSSPSAYAMITMLKKVSPLPPNPWEL